MKYLSPSDYVLWPSFAQRICFAYNSVPHESNANIAPLEMDFGAPPVSPFAPPIPPDTSNSLSDDAFDESQQHLSPPTTLSPALAAAAIRVSVAAFHRYAHAHAKYMQDTTKERLNSQGNPTTFQLHDRVEIYVSPTQAQLLRTGRRAKHVVAWRGIEIEETAVHTGTGGLGGVRGPPAHAVKGELNGRKEEMPKVGREGDMASSEGGNKVIFTGTDCPFSRISPVITRGDIFYRNIFVCKKSF
jgi:hypothetical protein